MIKEVQLASGFSDSESKEALEHMVESLAVRLTEGERKDFASQLPERLKDIALSVYPTQENYHQDMVLDFMINNKVNTSRAKKQIHSAWETLKKAISKGEMDDIRAQLPNNLVSFLH